MDKKAKPGGGAKRSSSEKGQKIKKESPSLARRKPMISESESDDEIQPPPPKRVSVKAEPPATPTKPLVPPPNVLGNVGMEQEEVVSKPFSRDTVKVKAGVKRKRSSPPEEESDEENGIKEEGNDNEEWVESGSESDDEFIPTKKPKKSATDSKNATPAKKTLSSIKKPSSTRKTPTAKKDAPTGIKKERTSAAKKDTPSSTKKDTPSKKASDRKKGSATPSKEGGGTPVKGKKKEEEKEVWRWWDEEPHPEGVKWLTLEHKGPYFAPPYERLPSNVKFYYNGKPMKLSEGAEEAATFFAKMLDHDYTTKDVFCKNFFADWRKEMESDEAAAIKDFKKCDFREIHQHFVEKSEARKQMTKEEKKKIKEANDAIMEEYGWAVMDGHKEKIGNFKTEPPGLFRGRGDHPKQGKIKRRVQPEDVTINIGKGSVVPTPPAGHKWKSVQHDNKVTWLASWTENIQGQIKYVMLNPTSRLKGEKDLAKYEMARRLKGHIEEIRRNYESDFRSKEMLVRQRAVALYFIDKLALRAGNEKDADEAADTVGCCSLRVEHIKLHEELDGKSDMVEFDFLGKDSIRYYNKVQVSHQVFKNLNLFMKDKETGDDLFDRLTTAVLNKHLSELMEGLTAKVFRTYNASITLQEQLLELTKDEDHVNEKILSYNRANRSVAVLCNHQRTAPKTFDTQMSNLQAKITAKEEAILDAKKEIKKMKKELKGSSDSKLQKKLESKMKQLPKLEEQLKKLEIQATDKEENKEIALGTSKLNYLDPRISVSWCKKWDVPIEKVYNRTQRDKFAWAIEMADETFVF